MYFFFFFRKDFHLTVLIQTHLLCGCVKALRNRRLKQDRVAGSDTELPNGRQHSRSLALRSAGLDVTQRLFVCIYRSQHLVTSTSTAASSSAAAAWLAIAGCVRWMTNTASSLRSFSATSVKPWMEELMNSQRRLLSRAAVRVIYQAGIIEARGDEGSAWPLAPSDNGPTRPPRPETHCYLACFSFTGRWSRGAVWKKGRQVEKGARAHVKFTLLAFSLKYFFNVLKRRKTKRAGNEKEIERSENISFLIPSLRLFLSHIICSASASPHAPL